MEIPAFPYLASCLHGTDEQPPTSYATGSFRDDLMLLARAFAVPFTSPALAPLSHASRLVCCDAGPFRLPSPRRPEPSWWLVRDGSASLGRVDADGSFVERCRVGPGQWFDVTGALSRPGHWADAVQLDEPLELLALPHDSLLQAGDADPMFAVALRRVLQRRRTELASGQGAVSEFEAELLRRQAMNLLHERLLT